MKRRQREEERGRRKGGGEWETSREKWGKWRRMMISLFLGKELKKCDKEGSSKQLSSCFRLIGLLTAVWWVCTKLMKYRPIFVGVGDPPFPGPLCVSLISISMHPSIEHSLSTLFLLLVCFDTTDPNPQAQAIPLATPYSLINWYCYISMLHVSSQWSWRKLLWISHV